MVAIFTEKVMTEAWKMIREGRDRPTEQGEISSNSRLKQERAAGEGLFGALRLTLRAALKRVVSQGSTRTLIEGSHPSPRRTGSLGISLGLCAICKMVVGEGLFGALRLTLRAALKRVVSQGSTRTLIEGSHPSPRRTGSLDISLGLCAICKMVVGEGFEPSKSVTADLQSAPFGRSGIPPGITVCWQKDDSDGGGRRIRTFEVCDGRFTVCSLWPLGNPTMA